MNRSPSDCCGNGSLEKSMRVELVAVNEEEVLFLVDASDPERFHEVKTVLNERRM